MENKVWKSAENVESIKTPYEILYEYASKVKDDMDVIEGYVTELISESREEIIYALYLVVPQLKNFSYRLIEVVQPNAFTFYPVKMKLFGQSDGNIIEEKNIMHDNFEEKLIRFIESPTTRGILQNLLRHLEVVKKYNI